MLRVELPRARCCLSRANGLRHAHAAQLRSEDVDIGIISLKRGHASITTTARYLDHLAPKAVIKPMRGRSWTEA
jgi:integrase